MLVSAEVRWFWPDEAPGGLFDWFVGTTHHPRAASGAEERTDEYLRDPDEKELGIKRRGGREIVEVKGLVAVLAEEGGIHPFLGRIEMWTKWTSSALDLTGRPTTRILKKRWMRKVEISDTTVHEVAGDAKITRGCNVEITEVRIAGGAETWWTFGFESFGERTTVERDLLAAVELMARRQPPALATMRSESYPAWLMALPGRQVGSPSR